MARKRAKQGNFEAFKVEVTVSPSDVQDSEHQVSKQGNFKTFAVSKSNEERREIICIAMVADEIDADGDMFTPEAVEYAANKFISEYHISKDIGLCHSGARPDVDMTGSWYTNDGGVFDGLEAPANSWVMKAKINDDDVWSRVKSGELTGLSIEGPAEGYRVSSDVAKSVDSDNAQDESPELKRVFTKADPHSVDIVGQGANLKVLIFKAKNNEDNMPDKKAPEPEAQQHEIVVTEAVKGKDSQVTEAVEKSEQPASEPEKGNASEDVTKAKTLTPKRKDKIKALYLGLKELADDAGVDLDTIEDDENDDENATVKKAKELDAESIGQSVAKSLAPAIDQLSKRLELVEKARSAPALSEPTDPKQSKTPSKFDHVFEGIFSVEG